MSRDGFRWRTHRQPGFVCNVSVKQCCKFMLGQKLLMVLCKSIQLMAEYMLSNHDSSREYLDVHLSIGQLEASSSSLIDFHNGKSVHRISLWSRRRVGSLSHNRNSLLASSHPKKNELPSGKLTVCELERSTIFNGKIHYFYGHFQ